MYQRTNLQIRSYFAQEERRFECLPLMDSLVDTVVVLAELVAEQE